MADFKTRIDDLTGFGSTDDVAIVDWLTAGAREIIDVLPVSKLDRMSEIQLFTGEQGVEDSKILHVLRKDENNSNVLMPCRKIHASQSGRASDSNYMEFATSSDPVYYLENKRIYTLPASASSNDSKLVKINEDFTILATDTVIDNFPKEATNAVVLYASRNALMRLMNNLQSNNLIDDASTGALALMNAEIDDVVNDTTGSLKLAKDQIDAFVSSIGDIDDTTELFDNTNKRFTVVRDALVKAQDIIDNDGFGTDLDVTDFVGDVNTALGKIDAHLVDEEAILTNDPTTGAISTALTAINAAVDKAKVAADKFLSDQSDSVFGDEDTFLTDNSQLTRVKDALDKAQETITGSAPSSTTSARGAQAEEDVELVTSALNISQTEIARAQAHLAEWTSIGDMRVKEAQIALSEADGYAKEVQARLGYASAYIAAANARTQEGSSRIAQASLGVSVAQQELQRANVAIAEINSLMASYSLELQSVAPYMSEVSGRLATAAQYGQEFQARLTRDQAKYQWYTQQYQMLSAQFQEALQLISVDKIQIEEKRNNT
jgi:hypothetical protein